MEFLGTLLVQEIKGEGSPISKQIMLVKSTYKDILLSPEENQLF